MFFNHNDLKFPTDPRFIRNICILAHVDHGKTSLVDHLIASNKIISDGMAGKFRYMDYKEEEHKNGVTMKSAGISLNYWHKNLKYLINVVDTPGHIDFSFEVSCAVRICDGAVVLIDVVEGVCPQTEVVLRQSWKEGIVPCLAINKIDRLVHELRMTPMEAYIHISNVVDQANALMFNLYQETGQQSSDGCQYDVYFSPVKGNVIFCSGLNGWAFRVQDFSDKFSGKFGVDSNTFLSGLWGDFYFKLKTKTVEAEAFLNEKKPMFVTFILENIWSVYNAFNGKDANQAAQIRVINAIDKNIKFDKFKESYERFTIVMRKWLSISDTLLRMVVEQLDSPQNLSNRRIENLLSSSLIKFKDLPESSKQIKEHFERCSNSEDSPVIVFVSKMVHFDDQDVVKITNDCPSDQERFLAFSRIFSGTVKIGQELYVLTPKYVPGQNVIADLDPNVYSFTVNKLFMLMGRDLISVTSVPSGNIFGISGLDGLIFKSGTLSSTLDSPPFTPLKFEVHTIMSVVVEPESLADYDKLVKALTTLAASDPILECAQSEKGEHLLNVVGEVHLIKCTKDLQRLMGESKLTFSKPTVQLRETVSHNLPAIIYPQPLYIKSFTDLSEVQISGSADSSSFSMLDDCFNLKIHVDYITDELIEFLEANQNILDDECNKELDPYICADLKFLLDSQTHLPVKKPVSECLLCFSQGLMTNILLCDCDFDFISWFDCKKCSRSILDDSLCRGLQLVCKKGPLMSEKMTGVCFVIQEIQFKAIDDNHDTRNNYKLVGLARQCFYASLVNSYRLRCSVPVYQCIIMIGKKFLKIVYGLLKKRFAKILSETCVEGTSIFTIISNILAPEILGMYEEARCQTSGTVQIQFTFSHWENIETDPLFDESTSDQFDIHQKLRVPFKTVQDYVLSTRKAKGFSVDEKLIQDSEKQRTMKRNK